jgi:hypothetical protein
MRWHSRRMTHICLPKITRYTGRTQSA